MTDDLERREYWKRRARKAEATIERQRPVIEAAENWRMVDEVGEPWQIAAARAMLTDAIKTLSKGDSTDGR